MHNGNGDFEWFSLLSVKKYPNDLSGWGKSNYISFLAAIVGVHVELNVSA